MRTFYEYVKTYSGTDANVISFKEKFADQDNFPRSRLLLEDFDFWYEFYERYLSDSFCFNECREGFRRLFGAYRRACEKEGVTTSDSLVFISDTGGYDSGFQRLFEVYSFSEDDRIPERAREYYKKLITIYSEFSSLFVLPPKAHRNFDKFEGDLREDYKTCEPLNIITFSVWWFSRNLPMIEEGQEKTSISISKIKDLLLDCTSLYMPEKEIEAIFKDMGYEIREDGSIEVWKELPIFRMDFLKEPSKKEDKSRWI